jgi:hypothetical protein
MAKAPTLVIDILGALVDQFAPVRMQCHGFRPTQITHDRLWKSIKPYLAERPNDKSLTLSGLKYVVELDSCQIENKVVRKPSVFERLKKLFGAKRFWSLVEFPVTPVFGLLGADDEQVKNFVETTQTGYRKILSCGLIDDGPALAKAA